MAAFCSTGAVNTNPRLSSVVPRLAVQKQEAPTSISGGGSRKPTFWRASHALITPMRTHHSSTIYFPHPNFNKDTYKNKVLYLRGKQDNKLDYLQGIGPLFVTMDYIFSFK